MEGDERYFSKNDRRDGERKLFVALSLSNMYNNKNYEICRGSGGFYAGENGSDNHYWADCYYSNSDPESE